jgi:hypothetical protein
VRRAPLARNRGVHQQAREKPSSILEAEDARGDVGRHVLDVGRVHGLLRASGHEDFDRVVAVAVGALIERTL